MKNENPELDKRPEPYDFEEIVFSIRKILRDAYSLKKKRVNWLKYQYKGLDIEEAEITACSFNIKDTIPQFSNPDFVDRNFGVLERIIGFAVQLGYQNHIRSESSQTRERVLNFLGCMTEKQTEEIKSLKSEIRKLQKEIRRINKLQGTS